MKTVILALAFGACSATTIQPTHVQYAFEQFKSEFGKIYASAEEEAERFKNFHLTLQLIEQRNKEETGSATHGITKFADLSKAEFKAHYLNYVSPNITKTPMIGAPKPLDLASTPSADWTNTYTTPVKDQGYCGSCWAFSVTEQIESDWMRTGDGSAPVLSAQQVTSCTSYLLPFVGGCNGGQPEAGYEYAEDGLVLDSDYPYTSGKAGVTGECTADLSEAVVKTTSYTNVCSNARCEDTMGAYVSSTGPLSIVVDASKWSTYTGGILETCGTDLDHAVQVVGIDTDEESWKVRNSWGTSWGEAGFIRLAYGQNTCGLTSDANFATVEAVKSLIGSDPATYSPNSMIGSDPATYSPNK